MGSVWCKSFSHYHTSKVNDDKRNIVISVPLRLLRLDSIETDPPLHNQSHPLVRAINSVLMISFQLPLFLLLYIPIYFQERIVIVVWKKKSLGKPSSIFGCGEAFLVKGLHYFPIYILWLKALWLPISRPLIGTCPWRCTWPFASPHVCFLHFLMCSNFSFSLCYAFQFSVSLKSFVYQWFSCVWLFKF